MGWTEKSCVLSDSAEKLGMKLKIAACTQKEKRFVKFMSYKYTRVIVQTVKQT